jgi:hypothetical protein
LGAELPARLGMDGQSSSPARGLPPTGPRDAGPRAAEDDDEVAENVVCVNRRDALLETPDALFPVASEDTPEAPLFPAALAAARRGGGWPSPAPRPSGPRPPGPPGGGGFSGTPAISQPRRLE